MPAQHDHELPDQENQRPHHHRLHQCGNLFGCGDEQGTGVLREDLKDAAVTRRSADRLLHMDEMDQETLDRYLTARGRSRRTLLRASSFMGALAAVGPWFGKLGVDKLGFGKLAFASDKPRTAPAQGKHPSGSQEAQKDGREHIVDSLEQTVRLGVFDTTLAPIVTIESGDTLSFPNTWSHFMNKMQPGVPVDQLAELRKNNPGRGPHSIIGPIAVKNAEPGDVLEIRYKRFKTVNWAAVLNNPGALGTGLLAADYPQGQIKYLDLDLSKMSAQFAPNIKVPLKPFQGTL